MWPALFTDSLLGWSKRRQALRELKNLQRHEELVLKLDEGNLVNRAKAALGAGDSVAALHFWREALERYPHFAKTSHDALEVLLGLKHFDEAEALMVEGQQRAPRDPYYANGYALIAERSGDTKEAINRWQRVRKKFPSSWMGYANGVMCLAWTGQYEAAEALSKQAIEMFPREVRAWISWAHIAERRRDWPETIHRWDTVRDKFNDSSSYTGIARGLEGMGRIEEAEAHLRESQLRFPLVHEIAIGLARLANLRGDNEETARLWADARRRFPLMAFGYREGFRHLVGMGRYEDAEAISLTAIDRFPAEAWPAVEYAQLAHTRHDWEAAAARWAAVRTSWPDRQDGYLRGAEACTALGRQDEAAQLRDECQRRFPR
jgi:tetratricopeptide (TPR) repeat protein